MASVYVEVELDDFSDDEIISEAKSRGYRVVADDNPWTLIERTWNRGQKKDALIYLERFFPELLGISKLPV